MTPEVCISGIELASTDYNAAILEWFIAFGFTFYLLTFWYDLRQAKGVQRGEMKEQHVRMAML
jgi:hypothetical protein